MKTILQIAQRYQLHGGSDRVFFELERLLEQHGHRVIPFTAADPNNAPSPYESYFPIAADFDHPRPIDAWRFLYSRPARASIRKLLGDHHIDLAHLHIYYGKLTSSILEPLKRSGIPIVQTLHEYKLICPVYTLVSGDTICEACQSQHFFRALPRRCNQGSLPRTLLSVAEAYLSRWLGNIDKIDHFVAISDFQRRKLIEHGVPANKISTLHNFIDSSAIKPQYRAGDYLLYFGRLERLKGVFTLVEAAAHLSLPLKIVGTGKAEDELRAYAANTGLSNVEFLGFQNGERLSRLIRESLCTVVPSEWYEPFGLTVIESMAHGKSVVASRIGGITELIDPGENGYLFTPGDAEDLAACLEQLATNPQAAAAMGQAGREKVEREFGPQEHYRRLMEIYQLASGSSSVAER